jgi:hypothetical protein
MDSSIDKENIKVLLENGGDINCNNQESFAKPEMLYGRQKAEKGCTTSD